MTVRVIHGANEGRFDLRGKTVSYVSRALRAAFNIPHDAVALVGGKTVASDYILSDGESVEFLREVGVKGGLHDFWSEAELLRFFGPESLGLMKQHGFQLSPHLAATADEVIAWQQWLMDRSTDPTMAIDVQVDVASGTITVSGVQYEIDQQLAAVVQCLLDAKGEPRSTTQMKLAYPSYVFDERLDMTIKRKLKIHKSGIGQFIKSDRKGYRLEWQMSE
ncbi:hypothetical protein FYZ48_26070 [Gimesia chilikensis]|uniref:hypothetical protein n=1 Tax=Gimesia chilikensis TaxID=2605989 RepID=UPI0011EDD349|nr:hypothetical protein [Gimesia chilikensis]KAA0131606.1 hypothetical protein FYZ48_26070 [Gimesia chilikensis]